MKVEERKFLYDANGFFVCKMGAGNPFSGKAPGALEVIPGERPNANLDNIWGSGFDELRDFVVGAKDAEKWSTLFLVTSPSGSTDKNNILLVGPQGCGKTQVMRAMATQEDSISIFATGSDFLTCWSGEAQKNPKRLFDAAIKMRKQSGKPIHILIDEIDMVVGEQQGFSSTTNLATEFQNLMDGVVAYPGITVWGATNHPDRIPAPMLRRFSRTMIVGELDQSHRELTLEHYIENFLPVQEGLSAHYEKWAVRLEGATGDIVRKVIDEVWLRLMRSYISENVEAATDLAEELTAAGDNVLDLDPVDKKKVLDRIAKHKVVTPELVEDSLVHILENFAVQQQIQVAKRAYATANQMFEKPLLGAAAK